SEKSISAGRAAERQKSKGSIVGDPGLKEHEGIYSASIDRQIFNFVGTHHARHVGFGSFDDRRLRNHVDLSTCRGNVQSYVKTQGLTDGKVEGIYGVLREARFGHRDGVTRRWR